MNDDSSTPAPGPAPAPTPTSVEEPVGLEELRREGAELAAQIAAHLRDLEELGKR